jgi:hypothetical protein
MSEQLITAISHADQLDATIRDISLEDPIQAEIVAELAIDFLDLADRLGEFETANVEMTQAEAQMLATVLANTHARMRLKQLRAETEDEDAQVPPADD